jgi:hypothetical protein
MGRGAVAESTEVSLPVYFPNTTDSSKAVTLDVRPGATIGGLDLTVVETRAVRIRGQVTAGGQPGRGASVSIIARSGGGGLTVRSTNVNDNGNFEIRGLAPGSYELVATLNAASNAMFIADTGLGNAANVNLITRQPAGSGPRMAARTAIDVFNTDIENVFLNMDAGFTLMGRVSMEGRASIDNDPAFANVRVQLVSEPNVPPLVIPGASLGSNGTFSIDGVTSGDYRLSVSGLPQNTYVRSARLGAADMLNGGMRLERNPQGTLDIVLGTNPGALDVTVFDDRQAPVPGVTVVLVPDPTRQRRYEIYRSATSDSSGRVRLDGIVPGDYRVYAWEEVESNAWTDPDFMRNFENRGVAVRIGEASRPSAEVRLIPYKVN